MLGEVDRTQYPSASPTGRRSGRSHDIGVGLRSTPCPPTPSAGPVGEAVISVIIPAHDEEHVIAETLRALLDGADPGELEVIVACNGCTDDTAGVAARFGEPVRVVETPVASKMAALNLGDEAATGFPRIYQDADVHLSIADVRRIAATLEQGDVLAAAPQPRFDLSSSSWAVSSVYRIYSQLSVVRENLIGAGVYALSETGRRRFDRFPDIMSDDLFVSSQFAPHERRKVEGAHVVVRPPATAVDLIRTKTRAYVGARHLHAAGHRPRLAGRDRWYHVAARDPRLLPAAVVYVLVISAAKARAWRRYRRGELTTWDRDDRARRTGPTRPDDERPPGT